MKDSMEGVGIMYILYFIKTVLSQLVNVYHLYVKDACKKFS